MSARDGLDVLRMKDEIQRKVQDELAGLPVDEQIRKIREMAGTGALADWWNQARSSRRRKRRV